MDDVLVSENPLPPQQPRRSTSFYIKRITGAILLVALACVFFYSAYTKLGIFLHWQRQKGTFPVTVVSDDNTFDSFQWTFLDLGINSMLLTGIIARLMIGMELLLGLFLLFHIYLKAFTYKAVIAVLSIFIIYLLIVIMKQGNSGNCGCFGTSLAMTPLQAIWKNVAMIAATLILWKIYDVRPYSGKQYAYIFVAFVALVALSVPFLMRFMFISTEPDKYTKTVNLAPLYKYLPAPPASLMQGKHILAFMSLTCHHCQKAAYLLQIIHHEHPNYPIYLVLDGPESYEKNFFDLTHADSVPHLFYPHTDDFMSMSGPGVPSIYWINNGKVEYKSTYAYYQLDPTFMAQWLKK